MYTTTIFCHLEVIMKNGLDMQSFDSKYPYKIYIRKVSNFNLHWHNYLEIFYVQKGNIRLTTGDFSFHLDEGHICFIDSGTIHSVNQTDVDNEILVLQISTEKNSSFDSVKNYKFNSAAYLSDLSSDTLPLDNLHTILNNIYEEDTAKTAGYSNIILGYIHTLIGIMVRHYYLVPKTENDFITESNLARLSSIIEYLDEHYSEKISLTALADSLHMNYYYLSHFFKDTAGVSFQDYLNNMRVDKSLPLLSEPNSNITNIAYNMGFPNIKAYSKAFKDKFGVLPSEYKKTVSKKNENSSLTDDNAIIDSFVLTAKEHILSTRPQPELFSIANKFDLKPDSKHMLNRTICIYNDKSIHTLALTDEIDIDYDSFCNLSTNTLSVLLDSLAAQKLNLYVYNPDSSSDIAFLKQKAGELSCSIHSVLEKCLKPAFSLENQEAFSLLSGIKLLNLFINDPYCLYTPKLYQTNVQTLSAPFLNSSSMITSFGTVTPYLYAWSFIKKMEGEVIYLSNDCMITKKNKTFQILCYHLKSLKTYLSLAADSSFSMENYFFFANSFPSVKYSITFNNIKSKVKQTTHIVSSHHGCILSEWMKLGSPAYLDDKLISYLSSITKPKLFVKVPPFRETPIITFELPPLGFAYNEITVQ